MSTDIGPSTETRLAMIDANTRPEDVEEMTRNAVRATDFLKAISHEGRLMILCHLAKGEKSVTELEFLLGARQAAVSQQLSRLRQESLVTPRREGKATYYSLADERAQKMVELLYEMFCKTD